VASENNDKRTTSGFLTFWTTLPGILTGTAGIIGAVATLLALFVGDGDSESRRPSAAQSTSNAIAFLLPDNLTARYENTDRPVFEQNVKSLCSDCEVQYYNAELDGTRQQQQAELALSQGVDAIVLQPVDIVGAATIVRKANAKKVPVISYDRLVQNSKVDYYVHLNYASLGRIQATALVDKLKKDGRKGSIVMINGSPEDPTAKLFKRSAHSVLDTSGFKIAKEYDTPGWMPTKAQSEMKRAISALGKNGFVGVYAANDGTASGAIAALKGAGIDPSTRPVTGQDAELPAIRRILAGAQYMTVYKPIKLMAKTAAEWAVALADGDEVKGATAKENNGQVAVPTMEIAVKPVTAETVKSTVVADGYWNPSEICSSRYAAACRRHGIK
jgi:D-xylose transport system substrate-binding protein